MSNKTRILDINEWIDNYSTFMADEALKLLQAQGEKKGPEVHRALLIHFLARVLTNAVFNVLHERPKSETATKKEILEHNKKNFSEFKEQVQDMVALSFQTAMSHYGGKTMEYYCQIRPVPEPVNGTVN